jgi:glycosyltransferase involved in cell wall biosynthesis
MPTVLFYRDYRRFTGGHLKVKDYFDHVDHLPGFRAEVFFAASSQFDEDNPWRERQDQIADRWVPEEADVLFLAGGDWRALSEATRRRSTRPIINLIQSFDHAFRGSPLFRFLSHRALRICVSPELKHAIFETGRVHGPVWTIPNGIDTRDMPPPINPLLQDNQVLVAGAKMPRLARRLRRALVSRGIQVEALVRPLPRTEFFHRVRRSRVTLFLPLPREGFYLPALEAMALGTLVVCPDAVGNRSFCLSEHNCLSPEYTFEAIVTATVTGFRLEDPARRTMMENAQQTVRSHSLEQERQSFHAILQQVFQLWSAQD